jgi:Pyruvate/2-oxoacid:ferredoxin oxidoreductase delta subunit
MAESVLKKEFKEKDVQRLRNIIQGKEDERTTTSIGYTKKEEFHAEGDVWKEDGREWTIKNGIKQNITKLDKAKAQIHLPLFCPECSTIMKHRYDKQFYIQYNRCFNCQVVFESEIKAKGLWEEYEKNILNSDIDNLIKDFSIWIDEQIDTKLESYITEAGDVESWKGSNKEHLLKNKETVIEYLSSLKKH